MTDRRIEGCTKMEMASASTIRIIQNKRRNQLQKQHDANEKTNRMKIPRN